MNAVYESKSRWWSNPYSWFWWMVNILLMVMFWMFMLSVGYYFYSRSACMKVLEHDFAVSVPIEKLGLRVQEGTYDKWTYGFVFQPKDIDLPEYSVLCVFSNKETERLRDISVASFDTHEGNVADKHKKVTTHWLNPTVWRYDRLDWGIEIGE